ncbi:hypothetical protein ACFPFV_12670 [Salinicoccus siamensis]|uniref:hypothetical protein n=1 Tax=Salinicoccus siamensis TaxID=381830 RepID=UPI00361C110D
MADGALCRDVIHTICSRHAGFGNPFFPLISVKYTAQVSTVWKKVSGKHLQHLTFQRKTGGLNVILPQALPPTIPMLGNYLIIMLQGSATCRKDRSSSVYSVSQEAMAHRLGPTLNTLTIVALLFLLLSYPSALLINRLESKMNRRFEMKQKKMRVSE